MTFGIFATSRWTGGALRAEQPLLVALAIGGDRGGGAAGHPVHPAGGQPAVVAGGCGGQAHARTALGGRPRVLTGSASVPFARLFTLETDEQTAQVQKFFEKLDTPVDVQNEVFGAGKKQVSVFPLVGIT